MKSFIRALLLSVTMISVAGNASSAIHDSVPPSAAEAKRASRWIEQYVSRADAAYAFSAMIDGVPVETVLRASARTCTSQPAGTGATQYTVSFRAPGSDLEFVYSAIHYEANACIEIRLDIVNRGKADSPLLENIHPLDLVVPVAKDRCILHRALGESNSDRSFMPVTETLPDNMDEPRVIAPVGGRSSDTEMPFFNLQSANGGLIAAIGWAGQWVMHFQRKTPETVHIACGQQDSRVRLAPGEQLRTPRVLLQFWNGGDPIRGNNLFRQWMIAHDLPRRDGQLVLSPICGTVSKVEPDGSYEPAHIRIMEPLAKRGFEVFWSDMDPQQWYPIGFPKGTGTWEPDPVKYPRGLKPIGDAAHTAGIEYLLWFEPERVVRGTRVDQLHPEWVTYPKDKPKADGLFRLDIPEARAWLTDYIDVQVSAARLGWIRWDFNMCPLNYWRQNDGPDRKGMTEMRHVEGLYAMWEELMRRHPGLVVDICASGGRRLDFETLRYGIPLWHSDRQCFGPNADADQLQNGGLFRWLPLHGCGNFGLEPSYLFRSGMTPGNLLVDPRVFELLDGTNAQGEEAIRRTIAVYKKVRPCMLGDFYPLFPHDISPNAWYGYQFQQAGTGTGCAIVFRRAQCANSRATLALQGLDGHARYEVTAEDDTATRQVSGRQLGAFAIDIPEAPGSAILYYRKIAK